MLRHEREKKQRLKIEDNEWEENWSLFSLLGYGKRCRLFADKQDKLWVKMSQIWKQNKKKRK